MTSFLDLPIFAIILMGLMFLAVAALCVSIFALSIEESRQRRALRKQRRSGHNSAQS